MGRKKKAASAPTRQRPQPAQQPGSSCSSDEPGPAAVLHTPQVPAAAAEAEAAAGTAAAAAVEAAAEAAPTATAAAVVAGGDDSPPHAVRFPSSDAIATVHQLNASSSMGDLSSCSHAAGHAASPSASGGGIAGCWRAFEARVKQLKREVLALYYATHDPRTPLLAKVLPWLVLAYALSPIDLVPDFIPVLGYLDDMLLLPLGLWLALKLIPAQVMADSRARAIAEPLRLSQNWLVAALIFTAWLAGLLATAHWLVGRYGSPQLRQWELPVLAGLGGVAVLVFVAWATVQLRKEARRRAEMALLVSAQQPLLPAAGSDEAGDQQSGDEAV